VVLENAEIACIYQNHSLLTWEKSTTKKGSCVVERSIDYPSVRPVEENGVTNERRMHSTHILREDGVQICRFSSKPDKSSQLSLIRDGNDVYIVVYSLAGKAEWVQLSAVGMTQIPG